MLRREVFELFAMNHAAQEAASLNVIRACERATEITILPPWLSPVDSDTLEEYGDPYHIVRVYGR